MNEFQKLSQARLDGRRLRDLSVFVLVVVVVCSVTIDHGLLSSLGGFWGGMATFVAILWIVHNTRLQQKSIEMQQEEIRLQRSASEKAADASQLDAFLRLFELARRAMNIDAKNIAESFLQDQPSRPSNDLSRLQSSFLAGDDQCYMDFLSSDDEFQAWIEKGHLSINDRAYITSFLKKFELLEESLNKLNQEKETYDLIVGASPIAHTARVLGKTTKFQGAF